LVGASIMFALSAVWALPMSIVPKQLMGVSAGFINIAGQLAALISPIVVGGLVGAQDGNFGHAFLFLIAALVTSSVVVLTLPNQLRYRQKEASSLDPVNLH